MHSYVSLKLPDECGQDCNFGPYETAMSQEMTITPEAWTAVKLYTYTVHMYWKNNKFPFMIKAKNV